MLYNLKSNIPLLLACAALATLLHACAPTGIVLEQDNEFGTYQLYVPDNHSAESNVVVIVHGTPRTNQNVADLAETFINRWIDFADSTSSVLIAPAFDQDNFASICGAGGGYRGLFGRVVGADEFLNSILNEVDLVFAPTSERRFYLYGHSAGGQFANRYVVRHPDRVLGVVLSAPGRYAFPDEDVAWANGMGRVNREITWPDDEQQEIDITPDPRGWVQAASLPMTVVIGDQDTDCQPCRTGHCSDQARPGHCADRDSTTRIAIGERWVDKMLALANSEGQASRVRMDLISGVGHNSAALTDASQEVLYNLMAGRVAVPDVTGMTEREATDVLESLSLQGRTGQPMLSDRPRGEVVMQIPQKGSWRDKGALVTFNLSLGVEPPPDRTTVPDVTGQTFWLARSVIQAAGFTPMPQMVDSELPFEVVVGQNPEGGDRAAPGSEVQIFLSRGEGEIQ